MVFKSLSNHDDFILSHKNIHFGLGYSLTIVDLKPLFEISFCQFYIFEHLKNFSSGITRLTFFLNVIMLIAMDLLLEGGKMLTLLFIVVACVCPINITIYYAVSI